MANERKPTHPLNPPPLSQWSTDILSKLEEADMSDLPKIFSLLQSA